MNLEASLVLIEESRRCGVQRFVFASTCSNYGKMKDANQFVDEESELSPVSLYAETKVAVERVLLASGNGQAWCSDPIAVRDDFRHFAKDAFRSDRERVHHGNAG